MEKAPLRHVAARKVVGLAVRAVDQGRAVIPAGERAVCGDDGADRARIDDVHAIAERIGAKAQVEIADDSVGCGKGDWIVRAGGWVLDGRVAAGGHRRNRCWRQRQCESVARVGEVGKERKVARHLKRRPAERVEAFGRRHDIGERLRVVPTCQRVVRGEDREGSRWRTAAGRGRIHQVYRPPHIRGEAEEVVIEQSHIRSIAGTREITARCRQRLVLLVVQGAEDIESIFCEVAQAGADRRLVLIAAALSWSLSRIRTRRRPRNPCAE